MHRRVPIQATGASLTSANTATFYTIDATTQTHTSGLPVKDPSNGNAPVSTITATAFDNSGHLWAIGKSDNGGSGNALYQINTTPIPNGGNPFIAATNIANLTGPAAAGNVSSMSFSSTNQLSVMVVTGGPPSNPQFQLGSVNTGTGALTIPAGATIFGKGGNALAYQPGTGTLYFANGNYVPGTSNTTFEALDPTAGTVLLSPAAAPLDYTTQFLPGWGNPSVNSPGLRVPAMAFGPDGNLYAAIVDGNPGSNNLDSALAIIDIDPTVESPLIDFSFAGNVALSSIAIDLTQSNVPEPGSLALLAATAVGALGYTWRRRRAASPPPISD